MSDKLLTLKEAACCLRLTEKQVRRLVREGKIPAYQIGGMYLRFEEDNIFALRGKYGGSIKNDERKRNTENKSYAGPLFLRIKDFFYFNDFYLIAGVSIVFLIYIILRSVH
jgi:excisionase family DNA binding protein